MVLLLSSEITRYFISVRTELAAYLPQVMGDRVQLQQVMMNLITNSIDAMKDVDGGARARHHVAAASKTGNSRCASANRRGVALAAGDQIFYAFFTTKASWNRYGIVHQPLHR